MDDVRSIGVDFPKENYALPFKDYFAELNGDSSFTHLHHNHADTWSMHISRSSGVMLEKATFSFLYLHRGTVNGVPGTINRFEAIIYPIKPTIPALFVMTDKTTIEDSGTYLVLYADLIIQDGESRIADKKLFSRAMEAVCLKHAQSFSELNAFIQGRGTFGGCAGACGMMGFFEEKDTSFIDEVMRAIIPVYRDIHALHAGDHLHEDDYRKMYASRARVVEWMLVDSVGTRILRENNIPIALIEASTFPPLVKY